MLEVAVGIAAGGILGMFVRYFPSHDQVKKKKKLKNNKKMVLYKILFAYECYFYIIHFQTSYDTCCEEAVYSSNSF